ncbi:MAG: hypothetical protein AB9897_08870 [Anaerolineaceae bacterium]
MEVKTENSLLVLESQAHGSMATLGDEDEGSSSRDGANRKFRENRKISGSPPGGKLPPHFPS